MATLDIEVGGYRYALACRDGEETHLRAMAAMVAAKAGQARESMGNMSEARQLLFAALLLADELNEARAAPARDQAASPPPASAPAPTAPPAGPDPVVVAALERLAARLEALAEAGGLEDGVEASPANA